MYLVELRPGKEELYRSVDELAAAIRSGDVDAHSRIFHRATSKWISITLHPQFKAIAAARESEPLPPAPRKQWTFLTSATEELQQEQAEERGGTTAEASESGFFIRSTGSSFNVRHASACRCRSKLKRRCQNCPSRKVTHLRPTS